MSTPEDLAAGSDRGLAAHPLSADLNWLLHRTGGGLGGALDAVTRRHGSGVRGYLVLKALDASAPTTQLVLGRQLGLDKTAVTAVLDALEGNAWVVRRPSPQDRRVRLTEVTAAGRAWLGRVRPDVEAVEADVLADLTGAEREQLAHLLQRLVLGRFADVAPAAGSCI